MSVPEFRDKCRNFALDFLQPSAGTVPAAWAGIGDWEHPYITLKPEFEAKQIEVFGAMAEKGYIYQGLKPVYWCPTCETALAEAEVEYADDPVTTIYVKFKVHDDKGKLAQYGDLDKMYFVIWTTTTWTLPGNMAICLNPQLEYCSGQDQRRDPHHGHRSGGQRHEGLPASTEYETVGHPVWATSSNA